MRIGSSSLNFFQVVFTRVVTDISQPPRDFFAIFGRGPRTFQIGKISAVNH